MTEYNPEVEEIDLDSIEIFEGKPDFDVSPTHQVGEADTQDDAELEAEVVEDA